MLSLVRGGPKILLFESSRKEELRNYFIQEKGTEAYYTNDAFENAGEDHTIVFIIDNITEAVDFFEADNGIVINEEPDVILCNMLNDKKIDLVSRSRIATRIIILRAMGDLERVVRDISGDYQCIVGNPLDIIKSSDENGTLVVVTEKPLHRNISCKKDVYEKALLINEKYRPLIRSLRSRALKYLNNGIGNKDWYELEIRIYDKYGEYDLHYNRLLNIMESLEIGIILGASWGKDYPRPMLAIEIYRVRFFTFYDPVYIKKMLLGLEYLEDGTRIVDYDLFYKRKKLYWAEAAEKDIMERHLLAAKYRGEILSKLSENEMKKLHKIENDILASRK
ncbi:MAG TPA: hypothetical protein PLW98_03775 [Bacillota bacterium]|nr:hypothetical protein [Sedimentibacter sp.]HNU80095.1 hypothetical protein [Bacillota bacterium]HPW40616.1 hypothetical protein [Bacillota bacterium]